MQHAKLLHSRLIIVLCSILPLRVQQQQCRYLLVHHVKLENFGVEQQQAQNGGVSFGPSAKCSVVSCRLSPYHVCILASALLAIVLTTRKLNDRNEKQYEKSILGGEGTT